MKEHQRWLQENELSHVGHTLQLPSRLMVDFIILKKILATNTDIFVIKDLHMIARMNAV